jgi:hypothetical protein
MKAVRDARYGWRRSGPSECISAVECRDATSDDENIQAFLEEVSRLLSDIQE